MTELILASGSPRRADLLRQLGLSFSVIVPSVDETLKCSESSHDFVERLAKEKNTEIQNRLDSNKLVLSADTVVVIRIGFWANRKAKQKV